MNRSWMAALALVLPGLAQAQPVAQTLLHLSADGSVQAAPDQLVADLVAQDTSPIAADAQRRVNALVAQGMQAARAAAGIDTRAVGYQVAPADEKRTQWLAQQTLELRGSDGPALLDLTNRLQRLGFVTASLDWRLSPALRRQAYVKATTAALRALQEQAASAAATLGLHVDHLKDVQVQQQMVGELRPVLSMAARVAPQATAAPEDVTARVSAEVVLLR